MKNPPDTDRTVLSHLPVNEQIAALHSMIAYLRSEHANNLNRITKLEGTIATLEAENYYIKGELKGLGARSMPAAMNTTQKIQMALDTRFAFFKPVVQGVMTHIIDIIIIAILVLAFSNKAGLVK